jgi:hypothetical protein
MLYFSLGFKTGTIRKDNAVCYFWQKCTRRYNEYVTTADGINKQFIRTSGIGNMEDKTELLHA